MMTMTMTSNGDALRDIAEKVDNLQFTNNHLIRTIIDALGPNRCICEYGIGRPGVSDHSLQCKILRAAVGYTDPDD